MAAQITLSNVNWLNVEVGRIVRIDEGADKGRIAVIVEIVDQNRVLVQGTGEESVARQAIRLSAVTLTKLTIGDLPRGARQATVKKFWAKADINEQWKESPVFKQQDRIQKRRNLSDFDRFKVNRLKKIQLYENVKALAKAKASS